VRGGAASRVRILDPFADRREIQRIWEPLSETTRASYFLSWPWVENWLATLPPTTELRLVVIHRGADARGADPVAACFVGQRTMLRSRVIPTRARFVNATGRLEFDEICVEHNGWLAKDGTGLRALVDAIPGEWDELVLDAMDPLPEPLQESSLWPSRVQVRSTRPCYSVNLDKVRAAKGSDYLSLLAGDLRSQIRRAYKLYQERGPITVEVATELEQAREFYREMVALHQVTWEQRGQPGAFSLPYFRQFHERLIETRLALGDIQLVRIRAGSTTLGCLYNFVWRGDVLFYQSGIAYESDNRLKPGLVCHAEAVKHNAARGALVYDFLAGDARYKRGLSTDVHTLSWLAVQRPRVRFLLEDIVRNTTQAWRTHRRTLAVVGK
jgi:CelD/BcsL family acetyltransferase involved in cellulose biosynthesis